MMRRALALTPRGQALLFLLLAALLVGGYVLAAGGGFPLDDSWIHQTYGRNLAQRGEWAFVPGQPSAASTSPLYTVLLAAGYALGVPFALWTHALGALTLAALAWVGARLAAQVTPERPAAPLLTGLALLSTWHLLWAAAAGMETALFGLFTLLLVWQRPAATPHPARAGLVFGGLAALTTLARPEGILLAGMIGLWGLLLRPAGWAGLLRWSAGAALAFAPGIAPYLALNVHLTGGLLPGTAAAKFEQHAILLTLPYPERYRALLVAILAGGQALLLPGVLAAAWRALRGRAGLRQGTIILLLLWALALVALYAARLPAAYQHGRYVIPALPALVVVGVPGLLALLHAARRHLLPRILTRALAGAALLLYLFFIVQGAIIYRVDVAIIDGEMVTAAHWLRDQVPPTDLLAVHDIGAVGYFAPRPLLDIAGLISPEVIPIVTDPAALWALLEARQARYLLAFPNQIPGRNPADPRLCPVFVTGAAITQQVGEPNMTIYRLAWSGDCAASTR